MKLKLFLLFCLPFIGQSQDSENPGAGDFSKLRWLEGSWVRTNSKPGRTGTEKWQFKSNAAEGLGLTLKGSHTAVVEKMKLVIRDGAVYYLAEVTGHKSEVAFRITSITENGFMCENPAHDFPKRISYQLRDKILTATISGNGKSIDYLFRRE